MRGSEVPRPSPRRRSPKVNAWDEGYTAEPDGSDLSQLTDSRYVEGFAAWSPDGTEMAISWQYIDDSNLSVMSADGSDLRNLATNWTGGLDFTWLSDGTKLACSRTGGRPNYTSDIYVMDPDGSNKIDLARTPGYSETFPDFSPDDSRMCLTVSGGVAKTPLGIYVTDADGSDPALLFEDDTGQAECDWSPGGGKVAFYDGDHVRILAFSTLRPFGPLLVGTPAGAGSSARSD